MPAATNGNDSEHSADLPGDKPPLKNPSHPWNPAGDSGSTEFVAVMRECSRCGAAVMCDPGVSRRARHDYSTDCNGRLIKVNGWRRKLSRRATKENAPVPGDNVVSIPWFRGDTPSPGDTSKVEPQ